MSSSLDAVRRGGWLFLPLALWACHRSSPAGDTPAAAAKRYTVRAEVVKLPPQPGGELLVRHEAIPTFTDQSGKVVGMRSMVMPYPVAASVPLADVAPGDKVEFVLSVDWAQGTYRIESLRKLPPDTALELGTPRPMGSMGSHGSGDAMK